MAMAGSTTESRGWQVGKTLKETNMHMLDNQVGCDIRFQVQSPDGGSTEILAHKYMLVSRSPVFEAMLCGPGDYQETGGEVVITDIEPEVFRGMLRFMYTEEVSITAHNVLYLMTAGRKYILDNLVAKCTEFLENSMSIDNVCTIFSHSISQDESELTDKCLKFMAPNGEEILKTEAFLELSREALTRILENNELSVEDEVQVFEACKSWAQQKCGSECRQDIRQALGDALFQVRFSCMNVMDFIQKIGPTNILTDEEFKLLCLCCAEDKEAKKKEILRIHGLKFCTIKRDIQVNSATVWRYSNIDTVNGWNVKGNADVISFEVDKPIRFKGVTVYSGMKNGDKHSCQLKLYDGNTCEWEDLVNVELTTTSESKYSIVTLRNPIRLCKNKSHAVKVILKGPRTYKGTQGMSMVIENSITFKFSRHPDSKNTTDVEHGQIPGMLFAPA